MKKQWSNRFWQVVVPALLIVNILLVWQNLTLRNRLEAGLSNPTAMSIAHPEAGVPLPPISALSLDKEIRLELEFKGEQSLLLYFSPQCSICAKQFPLWKELAEKLPPSVNVLLMAPDRFSEKEIRDFCASFGFQSQEVFLLPEESRAGLNLSGTPISMAVSSQGRVEKAWVGGWAPDTVQEVADFFGLELETPSPF